MAQRAAWIAAAAWMALTLASPASAEGGIVRIGMAISEAEGLYPQGAERMDGASGLRVIALAAPSLYGVRWDQAELLFDSRGRLDRVHLRVKGQDFDTLKAELARRLQRPRLGGAVLTAASELAAPVEFRICQMSDDSISVTFQRAWDQV